MIFRKSADDCTIWESCAPSCVNSSLQTAADEVAQWTTTNNIALSQIRNVTKYFYFVTLLK